MSFFLEPIPATLKFTSKDADSANLDFEEGLEDEYPIDDVSISVSDFVLPQSMTLADFKTSYLKHKQFEKTQRYSYDQDNLQGVLLLSLPSVVGVSSIWIYWWDATCEYFMHAHTSSMLTFKRAPNFITGTDWAMRGNMAMGLCRSLGSIQN